MLWLAPEIQQAAGNHLLNFWQAKGMHVVKVQDLMRWTCCWHWEKKPQSHVVLDGPFIEA